MTILVLKYLICIVSHPYTYHTRTKAASVYLVVRHERRDTHSQTLVLYVQYTSSCHEYPHNPFTDIRKVHTEVTYRKL